MSECGPSQWFEDTEGKKWCGEDAGGVTVAEVHFAKPGEAEGSIGAFIRFLAAARGKDLGPVSPEGWYWQGTVSERGVWTRPAGPFTSPADAIAACNAADWKRDAA